MRLHRLRIESFGPFAGVEHVDFDLLGDSGVFLLHGPTGAGKTSVLDAICFALYGQVPGARAAGRPRLRSDHAAVGAAPRVVLELTVGGRRLEVTRSPEWLRPKKRGTGTTKEPASTDVRELVDGQWQVLVGRRSDEAGLLLRELLGMGLEQFTKVVLLPQGEFAAFLRAGADQRAELLGRLFTIDRYVGVESWLRAERQRLAALVQSADAEQEAIVARAREAVHDLVEDAVHPAVGPAVGSVVGSAVEADDELALAAPPGPQLLEVLAATAAAEHRTATTQVERARADAARAQEQLAAARELTDRHRRRDELVAALQRLQARGAEHTRRTHRLDGAVRAAQLRQVLHRLDQAAAELAAREHQLVAVRPQVAPLLGTDEPPSTDALDRLVQGHQRDLAALDAAAGWEDELAAVHERLDAARTTLQEATAAGEAAGTALVPAEAAARTARDDLDAAVGLAATLEPATRTLAAAVDVHQAARQLVGLRGELVEQQDAHRAARDHELDCRQQVLAVRARRLAGMAAELAAGLVPGHPCAVCGSPEHPAPARAAGPRATEDAERAAQEEHETALAALREVEQALAASEQQRAVLLDRAHDLDVRTAADAEQRARDAVRDAQVAADGLVTARDAVQRADAAVDQVVADRHAADRRAAAARSTLAELAPRVEVLTASIDQLRAGDADLGARRRRVDDELRLLAGYRQGLDDQRAAARQLTAVTAEAASAVADLGFASATEAGAAALDEADLQALRQQVDQHAAALAATQAQLAQESLQDLPPADPAAWAAAQQLATDTAQRAQQCAGRMAVAARAHQALQRLAAQLDEHVEAHRDLRTRHTAVEDLSRCVDGTGGGNSRRMRLSAFVLAARLEEVAAAASERLLVMSDGRYALSHSDDLARSGARSGLGLVVVDGWTGVVRETTTLSGGESFLASLALALGLADVLQAEGAGTPIDTLFVDEGFGSLDEVALDDVMGVLDGLREGGRCVGVVSHVSELRDRIPTQLQVTKSRTGSRLTSTHADVCRVPVQIGEQP